MDVHYPTIDELATPEYVLAVLRDQHRQACQFGDADGNVVLMPDTTVAQWREACDLLEWRELGRAENEFWGIKCSDAQWRRVLTPENKSRLADVCQFIAARARRPMIRPAAFFGSRCVSAGAFLTIRSLLADAGAQAKDIAPSTDLAPYTRRYHDVFLNSISRLAPGALPLVRIRPTPNHNVVLALMLLGMICEIAGRGEETGCITIIGMLLIGLCYLSSFGKSRCSPTSVEFGELKTFRDLAVVVAAAGSN